MKFNIQKTVALVIALVVGSLVIYTNLPSTGTGTQGLTATNGGDVLVSWSNSATKIFEV